MNSNRPKGGGRGKARMVIFQWSRERSVQGGKAVRLKQQRIRSGTLLAQRCTLPGGRPEGIVSVSTSTDAFEVSSVTCL